VALKQQQTRPGETEEAYRRFCAGEQSAFDVIIEAFRQNLIFFLHGYVHNLDVAEDLAEDTFVELLVHQNRFHFQSSLKTYLFAVARHKAIDYLRREKRRGGQAFEELDADSLKCELPSTEEQYETLERAETLEQAMDGIPEEYREVLRLLYLEEMSYDEIAALMKKNKKQIDNLSYRARQALRGGLRKEEVFGEERS
jgi:RNA polymerase sigma-70 factor (ECF subfamily)